MSLIQIFLQLQETLKRVVDTSDLIETMSAKTDLNLFSFFFFVAMSRFLLSQVLFKGEFQVGKDNQIAFVMRLLQK